MVFSQPKLQGEWAEYCFITQAIAHGLRVSKPCGDSSPYDVVVDSNGKLSRVQVKSVSTKGRTTYHVSAGRGAHSKLHYDANDVDFLAVLVIPESVWYVIPIQEAACKTIHLCPHRPSKRRFEPFREAWHLLRAEVLKS